MKKKGIIGTLIIILLILAIAALGIIHYLYNLHTWEEIRICVGKTTNTTTIPCNTNEECREHAEISEALQKLEGAPRLLQEGITKIAKEAIYCEETCKTKEIRGYDFTTHENDDIQGCSKEEAEFVFQIKGKDALEIVTYLESIS